MLVIINADDLGVNDHCNDRIFDLMEQGRITSATVMANCPGTEDALRRALQFRQCSFGVHLNATTQEPLRADPELRPLLNDRGCFTKDLHLKPMPASTRRALFLEFCAQIDRVRAAGISISHLDSHHHVHNLPRVFPILKALQRKYGIRRVRITQNLYAPGQQLPAPLKLKKRLFNWALRYYYRTKTTDGFTDLRTFYQLMQRRPVQLRSVELMVHPGPLKYAEETALLSSPWLERLGGRFQTISYDSL